MSSQRSRHLFQITAARVRKGEELGSGYLNTSKHRDASTAEEDLWEFEVTPIMFDVDDPASLFGTTDCVEWGKEADRRAAMGALQEDVLRMGAFYDIWCETLCRPEEPTEYDMGVEFVSWADWSKVIGLAGYSG